MPQPNPMKFSDLEDGDARLALFKRELKTELEMERQERRLKRLREWGDRMPWIVAGAAGWLFFFVTLIAGSHK